MLMIKFVFLLSYLSTSIIQNVIYAKTQLTATYDHVWTDSSRDDPTYGGKRIINIRIWLPLSNNPRKWESSEYISQLENIKSNFMKRHKNKLSTIETDSIVTSLSASTEKYPLLIFSPALGGNLHFYTLYAEKLAQVGYVVVGVNHRYESAYIFDGQNRYEETKLDFHNRLKDLSIPYEITAIEYRRRKGVRQQVLGDDLIFVINQLQSSIYSSFIDFEKTGAFGHSIGGTAAVYAAYKDERIKAVISLDGTPPSAVIEQGLSVPFLFLEDLTDYNNHQGYAKVHQRRKNFIQKNRSKAYRILYDNFNHNTFLDINVYLASQTSAKQTSLKKILKIVAHIYEGFLLKRQQQDRE